MSFLTIYSDYDCSQLSRRTLLYPWFWTASEFKRWWHFSVCKYRPEQHAKNSPRKQQPRSIVCTNFFLQIQTTFAFWWCLPSTEFYHDIKLADNIEQADPLNLETIVLGDFNIDYLKSDWNKHRLIKHPLLHTLSAVRALTILESLNKRRFCQHERICRQYYIARHLHFRSPDSYLLNLILIK